MSSLIYKPEKTDVDISELLQEHKGLVYFLLSETKQLYNQDAESAAWEGLWDAIGTFDIFSKTSFSTYAYTVIKNAINNVLRKQIKTSIREELSVESLCTSYINIEDDYYSKDAISKILSLFTEYVSSKKGIIKNVLLFWYSSNFNITVSQIAKVCKCSPSYVSRVQDGFRAYLSGRLKRS